MSEAKLIAGLGNPGKDYEYTRHNLGFLVVRALADKLDLRFKLSSFTNGLTAEGNIEGQDVCLLMPLTYMNNSGVGVRQAVRSKNISLDRLFVLCDDFNLSFGQMRVRPKGSSGGQNGLGSIIEQLGTEDFARLRLGIGIPANNQDPVDYVLDEFSRSEKKVLEEYINEAVECCLVWLRNGIKEAMDQFNRRKENGKD